VYHAQNLEGKMTFKEVEQAIRALGLAVRLGQWRWHGGSNDRSSTRPHEGAEDSHEGGSPSMIEKFSNRPKGMHEKTFRGLRAAHDRAAERAMAGLSRVLTGG
jgi:hypothetical protein